MVSHHKWNFLSKALTLAMVLCSSPVTGQTPLGQSPFRIDTDVYLDITKPPVIQTLTIHSDGVFYDFDNTKSGADKHITVIDPARNRIVLLNPSKKQKAELNTTQLETQVLSASQQMTAKQRESMTSSRGIERDADTGEIVIRSKSMEYRASIQKVENPDVANLYCQFANWSARLNAIYPPHKPPYLRIELNTAMAAENAIPKELHRIAKEDGRESRLIAKLLPNWRLSADDQNLLNRTQLMIVQFQNVPIDQFLKD